MSMNLYHSTGHARPFDRNALQLDLAAETERLISFLSSTVSQQLACQGAVVAIDSSVNSALVLALSVGALGPARAAGLVLHEVESQPESVDRIERLAAHCGTSIVSADLTPMLEGSDYYKCRNEVLTRFFPEYRPGWKVKLDIPYNMRQATKSQDLSVSVRSPDGLQLAALMPFSDYAQIFAAAHLNRRVRMAMLYNYAEKRNYAVIGSASRDEYELGCLVKYGDASVDINPLTHLFRSQVIDLARFLGVPGQAYVLQVEGYGNDLLQDDIFLHLPADMLDLIWYGYELSIPDHQIASTLDLTEAEVSDAIMAVIRRQRLARYLCSPAVRLDHCS